MEEKRIIRSVADSLSRLQETKAQVASGVNAEPIRNHMERLSNPKSPSSAMKKAGIALIVVTPDPITAIPGVALIATSIAIKRKEPAKLDDLAAETQKILREIRSFSL